VSWDEDGTAHGGWRRRRCARLNRALGLDLPLDGPKTLNGLILEHLQDIPESGVRITIAGVAMEIVHTAGPRGPKSVRLFRRSPNREHSGVLKQAVPASFQGSNSIAASVMRET
jgi:Mg2+/Co2+ transporter CorB